MSPTNTPWFDPIKAAWNTAATYANYDDAHEAVGTLAERGFPIEYVDIVGSNLRSVERVTGRASAGRAVGRGALNGAGLGLAGGLVLGLFAPFPAWLGYLIAGALIGAVWGAGFGFAAYSSIDGRRPYSSVRATVAGRYDLVVRGGHTEWARALLAGSGAPGRSSRMCRREGGLTPADPVRGRHVLWCRLRAIASVLWSSRGQWGLVCRA